MADISDIKQIIGIPARKKKELRRKKEYDQQVRNQIEEVRQAAQLLRQQRREEKDSGIRITPKFKGLPR